MNPDELNQNQPQQPPNQPNQPQPNQQPVTPQEPEPPQPEIPQPEQSQPETSPIPPTPETPQSEVNQAGQMQGQVASPAVDPMQNQQQYYQQPQAQMYGQGAFSVGGYIDQVKAFFSRPKELIDSLSQNMTKSLIFVGINLGVFSLTTIIIGILGVLKANGSARKIAEKYNTDPTLIEMNGEFWGEIFKTISLSAVYVIGFLFLLAGVVYVLSMVGQKQADFNKSFGLTSILSLNYLAASVTMVLGLLSLYITDISEFISLLTISIGAIAFVYTTVLLIQGIVDNIGLSYFVTVTVFVVTVVLGTFIMGKMIKGFGRYFSVSFGSFGNNTGLLVSELSKSLNDLDDIFDFDF